MAVKYAHAQRVLGLLSGDIYRHLKEEYDDFNMQDAIGLLETTTINDNYLGGIKACFKHMDIDWEFLYEPDANQISLKTVASTLKKMMQVRQ